MLVKGATGDKPLSEPMMAYFTDAYMHPSALMNELIGPGEMQLQS